MYKVIFDTNLIRNKDLNFFLGNREELTSFSNLCEIIVPEMVVEELRRQKREYFDEQVAQLESNSVFKQFLSGNKLSELDANQHVEKLVESESIPYKVISLTEEDGILQKIKSMAINRVPPFKGGKKDRDAGFKDTYIFFTILEYLESEIELEEDSKFFVATTDDKLEEALNGQKNIAVIKNYKEFEERIIEDYQDEYFLSRLKEELAVDLLEPSNIKEHWMNIDKNHVVLVEVEDDVYIVELDRREVVGYVYADSLREDIDLLIRSESFENTREMMEQLNGNQQYFTDDDIRKILNASCHNNMVHWIAKDDYVRQFLLYIYEPKKYLVEGEVKEFLQRIEYS